MNWGNCNTYKLNSNDVFCDIDTKSIQKVVDNKNRRVPIIIPYETVPRFTRLIRTVINKTV